MNIDNLITILPYLAPILTALAGIRWGGLILEKLNIRQKKTEVESSTLENLQKNLDLYQEIVDDLNQKYKERITDFEDNFEHSLSKLKLELEELRTMNQQLERVIKDQKALIVKQSKSIKYYKNKYEPHNHE